MLTFSSCLKLFIPETGLNKTKVKSLVSSSKICSVVNNYKVSCILSQPYLKFLVALVRGRNGTNRSELHSLLYWKKALCGISFLKRGVVLVEMYNMTWHDMHKMT